MVKHERNNPFLKGKTAKNADYIKYTMILELQTKIN